MTRTIRRPTTYLLNVSPKPVRSRLGRGVLNRRICFMSRDSMHLSKPKTAGSRRVAALLACALGATAVGTAANAADSKARNTEQLQIQALQQQLLAVQAQLKQL